MKAPKLPDHLVFEIFEGISARDSKIKEQWLALQANGENARKAAASAINAATQSLAVAKFIDPKHEQFFEMEASKIISMALKTPFDELVVRRILLEDEKRNSEYNDLIPAHILKSRRAFMNNALANAAQKIPQLSA